MAEQPSRNPRGQTVRATRTGLEWREEVQGTHRGDRHIRIARHQSFEHEGGGVIRPRPGVGEGRGFFTRLGRFLMGKPLASEDEGAERLNVPVGLAIFASDNISSSAYATEEIMRVLVLAGVGALSLTMPITAVIVGLIVIVVVSYRQVIQAYPEGGGSYIVAHENLGSLAGLVAAAALLTDYILTVAVSTSAGVTALTSLFPQWHAYRVEIALVIVVVMTIMNMRGITEAGRIFAVPTYLYLVGVLALLALGLFQVATGTLGHYQPPPDWLEAHGLDVLGVMLVLRAFASGSVALTGTEAVSNGVPAFKRPEVGNAQTTLVIMGALFATIFVGLSFIAGQLGVVPDPHEVQTVISQIARTILGVPEGADGAAAAGFTLPGAAFWYIQITTALILVLAANTAFSGFPRLASVLARDQYLPRQFSFRGDRLAFTGGIWVLAIFAVALIVIYEGSVTGLIPLYTVGVFIAFTLSQIGLVRRWWLDRGRGWQFRLGANGLGAMATGVVAVVVGVSKFMLGAWMVLVLLPVLVGAMWAVRRHYSRMTVQSEPETPIDASDVKVRTVVPIANLEMPARQAIAYAEALAGPEGAVAVHVTDDDDTAQRFRDRWTAEGYRVPLVIIESPFRSLIGPMLAYIQAVRETHPDDTITVILPEYIPRHWWENLIHNQTAFRLRNSLMLTPGIVVASVPYHMK